MFTQPEWVSAEPKPRGSPLAASEARADQTPCQAELPLTLAEARALLDTGAYAPHRGIGPGAHYRKERGAGCYHLRVCDDVAYLHWDGWDPRRYPLRHVLETPVLWRPIAAGLGVSLSALLVLTLSARAR
jgi:hypothetical protein